MAGWERFGRAWCSISWHAPSRIQVPQTRRLARGPSTRISSRRYWAKPTTVPAQSWSRLASYISAGCLGGLSLQLYLHSSLVRLDEPPEAVLALPGRAIMTVSDDVLRLLWNIQSRSLSILSIGLMTGTITGVRRRDDILEEIPLGSHATQPHDINLISFDIADGRARILLFMFGTSFEMNGENMIAIRMPTDFEFFDMLDWADAIRKRTDLVDPDKCVVLFFNPELGSWMETIKFEATTDEMRAIASDPREKEKILQSIQQDGISNVRK